MNALLNLSLLAGDHSHDVPTSLNILAWACIPLLAFALPWLLLKFYSVERRKLRSPGMLAATMPAFVIACVAAALASSNWFQGLTETPTDILHTSRFPPTVEDLFLRTGTAGGVAFILIWLSGALSERFSSKREQSADATSESAEQA